MEDVRIGKELCQHFHVLSFTLPLLCRVMNTSKARPSPQRRDGMSTGSLTCTMRWMEPTIYTCWWSRSTKWPFIRSTGPITSCLSSQASLTVLESVGDFGTCAGYGICGQRLWRVFLRERAEWLTSNSLLV